MTAATCELREIRLYGELGRRFGRVFRLAVQSPAEAVRALCAVLPGFRQAFIGPDGSAEYYVFVGRGGRRSTITAEHKDDLVGADAPIRFVPVVAGAKRQGLGQTILGAVLLVVGVAMGVYGGLTANPLLADIGVGIGNAGLAMMLGGVIQMLSPQRKANKTENDPSYGMDAGAVNNSEAGSPVPIAYGRVIAGAVRISGGLSTDQIVVAIPGGGGMGGQELPDYMPESVVDSGASFVDGWGTHGS